jgi:hypothetical protein
LDCGGLGGPVRRAAAGGGPWRATGREADVPADPERWREGVVALGCVPREGRPHPLVARGPLWELAHRERERGSKVELSTWS